MSDLSSKMLIVFIFSTFPLIAHVLAEYLSLEFSFLVFIISFPVSAFYAGKYAKDSTLTTYTAIVSVLTFSSYSVCFPHRTDLWGDLVAIAVIGSMVGLFFTRLENTFPKYWERRVEMKHLKTVGKIIAVLSALGVGSYLLYLGITNLGYLMEFLDSHPWIVSLTIPILTFIGGLIIGRKRE